MNLYDYSYEKNIEFGILTDKKSFGQDNLDKDAFAYFKQIFEQSELVFEQKFQVKTSLGGLRKKYDGVQVVEDNIKGFYGREISSKSNSFMQYSKTSSIKEDNHLQNNGYCIRCKNEIKFDVRKPYCYNCYSIWAEYGNEHYNENYCHQTGRDSKGKTSMSNPILRKSLFSSKL